MYFHIPKLPVKNSVKFGSRETEAQKNAPSCGPSCRLRKLCKPIRPQADVEHDWRGKVFVDGVNILFLAGPAPPPEAFLHTAARGDHSGWYVHTAKAAHVLGVSHQQVLDAMERTAGGA